MDATACQHTSSTLTVSGTWLSIRLIWFSMGLYTVSDHVQGKLKVIGVIFERHITILSVYRQW